MICLVDPPRLIAVIGVAGCGKSTLGAALAGAIGAIFLDADDFHPEANIAKMSAGVPLTDDDRAPWIARLNAEVKTRFARGESMVLACSALKHRYRQAMTDGVAAVDWVFLDGPFALIAERIRARSAATGHYMPETLLRSQIDALERPVAALRISIELSHAEQLAAALFMLTSKQTGI